jgi:tetratricopeptide (TPR) repeat protein
MVQSVESRVHKLLLEHGDSLKVADLLLKDWDSGSLAWVEQNAVGHFLIKCGYFRAFLDQVAKNLKQGQRIPWSSFMEALSLSKTQLNKDDFDQIFVGAAEEQALKDLVKCVRLDDKDPRFAKIRNSMDNTVMRKETRSHLVDDPSDKTNAKTRTIQRPTPTIVVATPVVNPAPPPPVVKAEPARPEFAEEKTATLIRRLEANDEVTEASVRLKVKKEFEKALKKSPKEQQEAAIALAMMGAWEEGLQILKKMPAGFKKSFLELQFLLHASKNVEVLELSESLLELQLNLEQKSYVQFIQAQALLNLKRTNDAYTILEDLLTDDPDHYSAKALMMEIRARAK